MTLKSEIYQVSYSNRSPSIKEEELNLLPELTVFELLLYSVLG